MATIISPVIYKIKINMQQTLNFLTIIDDRLKRSHISDNRKLHTLSNKDKYITKRTNRYPYAKAIDFRQSKYNEYPKWLTQKEGFTEFMYKSYEKKLMSIPEICQKKERESDQKYFVEQFLGNISLFKHVPGEVIDIILDNLKTKYYKAGDIIHQQGKTPQFLGIIYIGSVQFKVGKRSVLRQKNDVLMKDAFVGRSHATIVCKEETILLALDRSIWIDINKKVLRETEMRFRDELADMMKSTFFAELHIKDKKAKQFFEYLQMECYFKDQIIQQAGSNQKVFYLLFKGRIEQQNHIYVREHNKWPMPHRRWQVRAVYNSFNQNRFVRKFQFFGDQEIVENLKFKAKYVAREWTVLFKMKSEDFYKILNQEDIKRLKKYRVQNADINYGDFETEVRKRAQSTSDRKNIVLKAINTSLAHISEFSPKRRALVCNYQKSMLRKALVDKTISF